MTDNPTTTKALPKDGTLKAISYWLAAHDKAGDIWIDAMRFDNPGVAALAEKDVTETSDKVIEHLREFLFKNGLYPWPG